MNRETPTLCKHCGNTLAIVDGRCDICCEPYAAHKTPAPPAVRSTDWLEEAKAALRHAQEAERGAGLEGEWNSLTALRHAIEGLEAGIALKRRASSNGESQS